MTTSPIRIAVADDQELVRAALCTLLATQDDFTIVGTAADGAAAVALCRQEHPDVVLMDVHMPILDGIHATRLIAAESASRIIILTTFDLDEHVYDALDAGASGFLLKDTPAARLFDAVRIVANGQAMLAPAITSRLIGEFARLRSRPLAAIANKLTARETDVLRLVAEGLSNQEIATRLVIGEQTVKTHVSNILTKLDLRDRTQAVVIAYETRLVVPHTPP